MLIFFYLFIVVISTRYDYFIQIENNVCEMAIFLTP